VKIVHDGLSRNLRDRRKHYCDISVTGVLFRLVAEPSNFVSQDCHWESRLKHLRSEEEHSAIVTT